MKKSLRGTRLIGLAASTLAATCAATFAGTFALAPGASAVPVIEPITTGLVGPLQLDVGHVGQIYTGQAFAGVLTRISPTGVKTNLHTEPGRSIQGVASEGYDVAFTVHGNDPAHPVSLLKLRKASGAVSTIADLGAFEAAENPDLYARYGFRQLSDACLAQVPEEFRPHGGLIDSNPYALLERPGGWFVADAGANAILKVNKNTGVVKNYFGFGPEKAVITAAVAQEMGLPACVVGKTYAFESVPTDVEYAPDGALLVTVLPGGPEDDSLGARGAIWKIPGDFEAYKLASGFLGATNLAVKPSGRMFVTELFGNRIVRYKEGVISTVADVPSPAGLEWADGRLIASTDVFGAGNVVGITP